MNVPLDFRFIYRGCGLYFDVSAVPGSINNHLCQVIERLPSDRDGSWIKEQRENIPGVRWSRKGPAKYRPQSLVEIKLSGVSSVVAYRKCTTCYDPHLICSDTQLFEVNWTKLSAMPLNVARTLPCSPHRHPNAMFNCYYVSVALRAI